MNKNSMQSVWAKAGLIGFAFAAPMVVAGHLNTLLHADLDGRQEVNTSGNNAIVGDPDGRGEAYVFGIDANTHTLCYNLQVKRIAELDQPPGNGRAAHIHAGKRGTNGPVVANLAWPQGGQSADCLDGVSQSSRFVLAGTTFANAADLIADILKNPDNYYINVHNAEYKAGAVRGQLAPARD